MTCLRFQLLINHVNCLIVETCPNWEIFFSYIRFFNSNSNMTLLFLLLSPPTKLHCRDVTMCAVHFWGQGRSYLSHQRVPFLWPKKKGRERGKVRGLNNKKAESYYYNISYSAKKQKKYQFLENIIFKSAEKGSSKISIHWEVDSTASAREIHIQLQLSISF